MKVYWKVEDGFVGNGEHCTEIPDEELEECLNPEQREMEIDAYVTNDFEQTISFEIVREESD